MTQHVIELARFAELFLKWNAHINLSAARTRADVEEHIADCVAVLPLLEGVERILDVGAGGGFPSVVIALCCPSTKVVALEPVHKKHAFLRTCGRELGLANFEAHAHRLEDHAETGFDVAMSRATFDLKEWLDRGMSAVRPGGRVIGFEGLEQVVLGPADERHPYKRGAKQRAFVVRRV
jgi:16S rRNA (guanine527-N7)-methyltransferase